MKRIGVVGGGMLGLTLALRLAQEGHRVTVLDAGTEVGGLTSSCQVGGLFCDRFYHVTLLSDFKLRSLLRELGLEQEIRWKVTNTQFYTGSRVVPLNNVIDYFLLPVLGIFSKCRLAINILYASMITDGRKLEKQTAQSWLSKISGANTYRNLWEPLLKAKLGSNFDKVSAAFIWSVIRRFYAARRGGMKTEMFGYVPGGYARVIRALSNRLIELDVNLQASTWVNSYEKYKGKFLVDSNQGVHEFDNLIVTCASPVVLKMCRQLSEQEKRQHQSLEYQGVVCVKLVVNRSFGGAYLTYIRDKRIPFTAIIEMSSLVDFGDPNKHLLYLPKYVPHDDPILDKSDHLISEEFIRGLMLMFSFFTPKDVIDCRVSRSRHVVALSTLNYSENMPSMTTSDEDLFIINSAQINNAALSVNETVTLAEKGVECVKQAINN